MYVEIGRTTIVNKQNSKNCLEVSKFPKICVSGKCSDDQVADRIVDKSHTVRRTGGPRIVDKYPPLALYISLL